MAGDFNDWSTDAEPLDRLEDGSLVAVLALEPGRSYRFRYFLGDGEWENDWAADEYVDNEHGGSDSVVHVPDAGGPPPVMGDDAAAPPAGAAAEKKAAAKKAEPAKKAAKKKAATKKAEPAKKAAKKKAAGVKKAAKKASAS